MVDSRLNTVVIKPRFLPRDLFDVCVGLPVGIFQWTLLMGMPGLLAFALAYWLGVALLPSIGLGFLGYLVAYGAFLLVTVWHLALRADGLHFQRIFGSPKFLPRERILSIEAAPRREVILRGWLWPPFPPREASPSLSASWHYRITWDAGVCYYPPKRPEEFERLVIARVQSRGAHLPPPLPDSR